MFKQIGRILLLALAGCSSMPAHQQAASPCAAGETTYECQVERYNNVSVP
jgi:hypothetical protein